MNQSDSRFYREPGNAFIPEFTARERAQLAEAIEKTMTCVEDHKRQWEGAIHKLDEYRERLSLLDAVIADYQTAMSGREQISETKPNASGNGQDRRSRRNLRQMLAELMQAPNTAWRIPELSQRLHCTNRDIARLLDYWQKQGRVAFTESTAQWSWLKPEGHSEPTPVITTTGSGELHHGSAALPAGLFTE
jgi:hypothetical protein